MFDLYSTRAKQLIFLARLESGARGAETIDLDDLLAALLVEDQNKIPDALEMWGSSGGQLIGLTTHQPFLPPDVATTLLENIQRSLPRSQSIHNYSKRLECNTPSSDPQAIGFSC